MGNGSWTSIGAKAGWPIDRLDFYGYGVEEDKDDIYISRTRGKIPTVLASTCNIQPLI